MPEAVIVDAIRTPIGRAVKGSLKDIRADDLAAVAGVNAGRVGLPVLTCGHFPFQPTRPAGAASARHSLHPLLIEGDTRCTTRVDFHRGNVV